jgi:predicted AAA+ superfamily ATPase
MVEKEIQRMKRIRLLLDSIPKKKILKKKLTAIFSLDYGISVRTVDNYLETLINAEKVVFENKFIWRGK